MLKIGISACFLYPDPQRSVFGPKTLSYLENDMARYLTKEGVIPVLIPDVEDKLLLPLVEECGWLHFPGRH